MNAEIIAVGTELLMGQIANTNAQYISQRLAEVGVNVYFHSVVGDNRSRMIDTVKTALHRSDLIVITGGLGPTQDDITKEVVAEIVGLPLILHKESEERIIGFFKKINRPMVESNKKQALIPDGTIVIPNNNGLAPGSIIYFNSKTIVLLPGPPKEMKPMCDYFISNHLTGSNGVIKSKYIKIFGLGEATLEEKILDLIKDQSNPTIAPYCNDGEVILRVTARAQNIEEAGRLLEPLISEITIKLGRYIYSMDGEKLEEVVVKILKDRGKTVALAESCTGGMISARITDIPGASEVFQQGAVTYSNQSKVNLLGVDEDALIRFGAVSHEVARQMAEGIRRVAGSDLGLSVTGIAGPGGGTESKPVGLVYIGLADEKGVNSWEYKFSGNRDRIRQITVLSALDRIRMSLTDK